MGFLKNTKVSAMNLYLVLMAMLMVFVGQAEIIAQSKKAVREQRLVTATNWQEVAAVEARYVVGLVIGIYLLAALIPSAITALNDTNTTGWTATQLAIWGVLSVIILAVVIMKISE